MIVQPRGEVILYKDVKISGTTQLVWSSSSERNSYFSSKKVGILNDQDYSYVQHSGNRVKIMLDSPEQYFTLTRCNYVTFYNEGFENIVWYASLYDWERINNHTAEVTFGIDYFQTYYFSNDLKIYTGQVAREGLSVADYNTLQDNPWANVPQMFTGENLPIDVGMEGLYDMINVDGSFTYNDERLSELNSSDKSAIRYTFKNFRAVLVAFQDERALGLNYVTDATKNGRFIIGNRKTWKNETGGIEGVYISKPYHATSTTGSSSWVDAYSQSDQHIGCMSYSNFPQPLYIGIFDINNSSTSESLSETKRLNEVLNKYAENNITSSIIGLFFLPECCYAPGLNEERIDYSKYGEFFQIPLNSIKNANYSPKLKRAPYFNLRVTDHNGNSKAFIIEDFVDVVNNNKNYIDFGLAGSVIGVPSISACPINYKHKVLGGTPTSKYGTDDRFVISNFPQIPYVIDGYLTYLSTSLQQTMLQSNNKLTETKMTQGQKEAKGGLIDFAGRNVGNIAKVAGGIASVLGGVALGAGELLGTPMTGGVSAAAIPATSGAMIIGGIGSAVSGGTGIARDLMTKDSYAIKNAEYAQTKELVNKERNRRSNGGALLDKDNYEIFFGGPETYLQDFYSPPSGDITPFMLDTIYLRIDLVHLRSDIIEEYDKFFKLYGYTSGLMKVPYIYNYIKGVTGDTNQPHWETMTELKEGNNDEYYDCTYCMMTSVNVTGVNQEAEQWIKAMFLNGMRFLRRHQ